MTALKVLDLFAGAGGFTLAGEMAGGYETVAFCEIDRHAQKVLRKNWPDVPLFDDVTKLKGVDVGAVDVITGGFPCQDLSSAGRGAGLGEGTRSGLFREMLRLACEVREITGRLPYIVFENVPRLLSGPQEAPGEWFGEFLWSLAEVGYDAEWFCITAASIGAPHERERVCVVAYANQDSRKAVRGEYALASPEGSGWIYDGGFGEGLAEREVTLHGARKTPTNSNQAGKVWEADTGKSPIAGEGINGLEEEWNADLSPNPYQASIKGGGVSRRVYAQHAELDGYFGEWGTWGGGEPEICGVDDGIPKGAYARCNGIMGNAIVPPVFAVVMKALRDAHEEAMGA